MALKKKTEKTLDVMEAVRRSIGKGGSNVAPYLSVLTRGSSEWYRCLVDYWKRRKCEWQDGWKVVEEEYDRARKMTRAVYNLEELRPARAFMLVQTIESMILSNRPKFFIEGFTARIHEELGPVLEMALNNEWRQDFRAVQEGRLCVRDAAKFGIGVMLTSYEAPEGARQEPEDARGEAIEARDAQVDDPALAAAMAESEALEASLESRRAPEERAPTFEGDSRALRGVITSRRVSPWAFLHDPDSTCLEDAKWVGRFILADLDAVQNDPDLKDTEDLQPCSAHDLEEVAGGYENDNPYEFVLLYELFVRRTDGGWNLLVLAEGSEKIHREEERPLWIGHPYDVLRWYEDGENFIPQSDVQVVMSEIVAERLLMTKVFDGYSREHVDLTFFDNKTGLTEEELHAPCNPEVGKYVGVNVPAGTHISQAFWKAQKDVKSAEALSVLAMIERSIQLSSGLGPNQFGQALKSSTSATEAATVDQFARARGGPKFSAVEEFFASIGLKRMGLMAQYYKAVDIARLVSDEAAQVWAGVEWTPADVQQGLRVIVEPGSTRAMTDSTRVNEWISLLGIVNQDPASRSIMDMPAMYLELLRRMGIHDGSKFVLMQDGQVFAENAAKIDAAQIVGGGGGRGSPPSLSISGGTPAQQLAGGLGVA